MRINKCWFCSANIYPGHGLTYVRSDAAVFKFCRSKCHKLFKKRLNPRKIKWTKISRVNRNKEVVDDPVHQFERRVNVPRIYNRAIMNETISAIPKILALRQTREDMYIKSRILSAKENQKEHDLAFIEKYGRLLEKKDNEEVVVKLAQKKEREVEFN